VIDNLKAAVTKADWFDPELNPKVQAFAQYYGVVFWPTRPYTPRHKGKVERGIAYVQDNALKGRSFTSLDEQNHFLQEWEQSTQHPDAPEVVRGDHLLDPLGRQVEEASAAGNACVGDEQVHGRMTLADPRRHGLDLGTVGDVAGLRLGAELSRHPLQALDSSREQDARPAPCGEEPCSGGPDPARPSGDDGDANVYRLTGGSGQAADDLAVVLLAIRQAVGVGDQAEPELGLDRLALAGQRSELHLVEIAPARPLDCHDAPQHRWNHGNSRLPAL